VVVVPGRVEDQAAEKSFAGAEHPDVPVVEQDMVSILPWRTPGLAVDRDEVP
jgi:hypothetical protein